MSKATQEFKDERINQAVHNLISTVNKLNEYLDKLNEYTILLAEHVTEEEYTRIDAAFRGLEKRSNIS